MNILRPVAKAKASKNSKAYIPVKSPLKARTPTVDMLRNKRLSRGA